MGRRKEILTGIFLLLWAAIFFPACGKTEKEAPGSMASGGCPYDLCVIIVVDQFGMDYIRRFESGWTGGLAELLRNGYFFRNAEVGHQITSTAPGHATLGTGNHPSYHGIIDNRWYSRDLATEVYSVKDSSSSGVGYDDFGKGSYSPAHMEGVTFSEIFHRAFPQGTFVSLGQKDYAAICIGGKDADHVYWFDTTSGGNFVTSSYYRKSLPDWVETFNSRRYHEKFRTAQWARPANEPPVSARVRDDFFRYEGGFGFLSLYPHTFRQGARGEPGDFARWFKQTPWSDAMLLDFGRTCMDALHLGNNDTPDVLCLCLKATDYIGHNFGPHSLEIWDHLQQLDGFLADFMADVEKRVDPERILFVLTADHGIQPIPEYVQQENKAALRIADDYMNDISLIEEKLNHRFGRDIWFEKIARNAVYLNYEALARRNVRRSDVEEIVVREMRRIDWVDSVYGRTWLTSSGKKLNRKEAFFRNSFHEGHSGDIVFSPQEFYVIGNIMDPAADHGSSHRMDRQVPLVFYNPATIEPAQDRSTPAFLKDLVPTLYRLFGLDVSVKMDGRPLDIP